MTEKKFIVTKSQLQRIVKKANTPKKILDILPKVESFCNKIASLREGAMAEHYLKQIKEYITDIKKFSKLPNTADKIVSYAAGMRLAALNLYNKAQLSDKGYPLAHDLYYLISSVV